MSAYTVLITDLEFLRSKLDMKHEQVDAQTVKRAMDYITMLESKNDNSRSIRELSESSG